MSDDSNKTLGDTNTKSKLRNYFLKSSKAFKEFGNGKFKHLLFTTGLEDDLSFDMFTDTTFNLDPNIGEFTADAFRLALILYLYHNTNVVFDIDLLSNEINSDVFTFNNNRFHPIFLDCIKKHLKEKTDFTISFLPRTGSSHWYTLCLQPEKTRLVIINPLKITNNKEEEYLENMFNLLCDTINTNLTIMFENSDIQSSQMSCGESNLLIMLSILTNGETGYSNLINHLKCDHVVNGICDIYDISLGKKCFCSKCVGENYETFKKYTCVYKRCIKCAKSYGGGIGLNKFNVTNCVFCNNMLTNTNSEIISHDKTQNKHDTEMNIRNEIIYSVEHEDLDHVNKGCNLTTELEQLKKEHNELKQRYQELLFRTNTLL